MLEKIQIKNFQPHKNLEVEFDREVTTVIGENDVGKSSLIRALRWVCLNKPKGIQVIRFGAKSTQVKLTVDGATVSRRKGSVNTYFFNGKKYSAVKFDVPQAIQDFLNVSDVNFQLQLDNPFWFSLSAGQVGKELNSIINLGDMDTALSLVSNKLRHNKTVVEVSKERLASNRKKRKSLAWVPKAESMLADLAQKNTDLAIKADSVAAIALLVKEGQQAKATIDLADNAASRGRKLLARSAKVVDLTNQANELEKLLEEGQRARKLIKTKPINISSLQKKIKRWGGLKDNSLSLANIIRQVQEDQKRIKWLKSKKQSSQDELEKAFGNRCPICGSPNPGTS